MRSSLNVQQTKAMFLHVAEQVINSKPLLTEIDSAIGDGDHGIGMAVGFTAAREKLQNVEIYSINDIFKNIGSAMLKSMGGASGVIFGTMFMSGIKGIPTLESLTVQGLAGIFANSLQAIKDRGKADVGDKTMIDALEPAIVALRRCADEQGDNFVLALKKAEAGALAGVESTKGQLAKFGRARSLGERALGHQDPGATSVWLIFEAMREWIEKN
jgi:dihydroxyacetone kinase phosphoprotein-dependent L subunit